MKWLLIIVCVWFGIGGIGAYLEHRKSGKFVQKYTEKGIITKEQKAQLPEILLEKVREALAAGNVSQAISYLDDCAAFAKSNDTHAYDSSITYERARCHCANGNDDKALSILSGVYTPQGELLKAELLLKQDPKKNYKDAVRYAESAMKSAESKDYAAESEALKRRAQAIIQRTAEFASEEARENARKRFEAAIETGTTLSRNLSVTSVRYLVPGTTCKELDKYLDMYNTIAECADAGQRKTYSKELSAIAFMIASLCCRAGFLPSAYAYLQKVDDCFAPQKDFVYAMLYARTGLEGLYTPIHYYDEIEQECLNKLDKLELPIGSIDTALVCARRAEKNGIQEASELITEIERTQKKREDEAQHRDTVRRVQELWDRGAQKKYGMSHAEYMESLEERREELREAAREQQQREAEQAARKATRDQRLERDMDISEMLQDKSSGGHGNTMKEKWESGEISTQEYLKYENKRKQQLDLRR